MDSKEYNIHFQGQFFLHTNYEQLLTTDRGDYEQIAMTIVLEIYDFHLEVQYNPFFEILYKDPSKKENNSDAVDNEHTD